MNQLQLKCSGGCEDVREVRASHEDSGHELPVARTESPQPGNSEPEFSVLSFWRAGCARVKVK